MNDDTTTTTKTKRRANGEGTIAQTRYGYRGCVSFTDPRTGKLIRKFVRGKSRPEVVDRMHELKGNAQKKQVLSSGGKLTVEQWLPMWLETYIKPCKAYSTWRGYEQHIRARLIPALGRIRLDRLTGMDVQHCLNAASEDGLSPSSVRGIAATLKSALSTAEDLDYVNGNAAKKARVPKQIKYKPKPLTADQGIRLLNVVLPHRYEAAFYVALLQGLRRGEVAGLQWGDVDFAMGYLTVRHALQRVKDEGAVLLPVKSEASERKIPLLSIVGAALRRRKERQEQERLAAGKSWKRDGDFIFTSRDGHRIMPEDLHRELQPALELAGLSSVRFHDLRHSTAIILQALGVDLKTIQIILGHSTFQITADFYAQGVSSEVVAATEKLNALFERSLVAAGNSATFGRTTATTTASTKAETIQ
jgi:integrase